MHMYDSSSAMKFNIYQNPWNLIHICISECVQKEKEKKTRRSLYISDHIVDL